MLNAELKERYALNYKLRGTEMYHEAFVYVLRSRSERIYAFNKLGMRMRSFGSATRICTCLTAL